MKKVCAYIRVSTDDQAKHLSPETQRQILSDYAEGHKLEIVRTFEETHSAYRTGRPVFAEMLSFLKQRKDVTGILAYKMDRLTRNLSDFATLADLEGVEIISATEGLPTGSSGMFAATIHAAVSRLSSDQTSERVKHAASTKVERGGYPGPAPMGYRNNSDAKTIEPDPDVAPVVKMMFEAYVGERIPLSELARRARTLGLRTKKCERPLGKASLHHMLQNPIYCGKIRWNGKVSPGAHEPIVSEALFEAVQRRLRGGSSPQSKRQFAYRGFTECGYCGCAITASHIKDRYDYYHCTRGKGSCQQGFYREEAFSDLFLPVIEHVAMPREQVAELLAAIKREGARRRSEGSVRLAEIARHRAELEKLRHRAYEDKLNGRISEERWLAEDRRWEEQDAALLAQAGALQGNAAPALDEAEIAFKLLQRAPDLYSRQTHEERGRLLRVLLSNSSLVGGKILPLYKKPFDLVAEGLQRSTWLPG